MRNAPFLIAMLHIRRCMKSDQDWEEDSAEFLNDGGVWRWGVRVWCEGGVWGWVPVRVGCEGDGVVQGWGARMWCKGGVWGWGVRVRCKGGVWGWGVSVGCKGEVRRWGWLGLVQFRYLTICVLCGAQILPHHWWKTGEEFTAWGQSTTTADSLLCLLQLSPRFSNYKSLRN